MNPAPDRAPPAPTRKRFRPKLWLTLAAAPVLAVLVALGTWQVRRYGESTAQMQHYSRQHDGRPPVATLAEAASAPNRLEELNFRRARLQGELELDRVQLLTARYVMGKRGFGVLAPLRVDTGPHPRILVHLGWVPEERLAELIDRLRKVPRTQVQGRLQIAPDRDATTQPVRLLEGRPVWLRPNPAALARRIAGLEPALMLQAGEQASGKVVDPTKIPVDGYVHPVRMLPTKHVEYAATWYGLALTLIAVWIALSLRRLT